MCLLLFIVDYLVRYGCVRWRCTYLFLVTDDMLRCNTAFAVDRSMHDSYSVLSTYGPHCWFVSCMTHILLCQHTALTVDLQLAWLIFCSVNIRSSLLICSLHDSYSVLSTYGPHRWFVACMTHIVLCWDTALTVNWVLKASCTCLSISNNERD